MPKDNGTYVHVVASVCVFFELLIDPGIQARNLNLKNHEIRCRTVCYPTNIHIK